MSIEPSKIDQFFCLIDLNDNDYWKDFRTKKALD